MPKINKGNTRLIHNTVYDSDSSNELKCFIDVQLKGGTAAIEFKSTLSSDFPSAPITLEEGFHEITLPPGNVRVQLTGNAEVILVTSKL